MVLRSNRLLTWSHFGLLLCLVTVLAGCSRVQHRVRADREVYDTIAERACDPRWGQDEYSIEMDPRSRYFDPYDPDRPPMPQDDPTSNVYMQCVDGKKGWKHWTDNGFRRELENPAWHEALASYVQVNSDGTIHLDMDSALRLAYVHSPSLQSQLETIYLSALDVSAERFRLDTQFFGGYDARYTHNGSLIPAGLTYSPLLGRFIVNPPLESPGLENNRLTVGRPFGGDPAVQMRRRFATAGELIVGFANSFVFEFTGDDANLASSLANFSLVQPLLRGAGRDVALENLTLSERDLLANVRAFAQYRQGFYTQVAVGELGVDGPRGFGSTTFVNSGNPSFSLQGGYIGLLQQQQQIRNSEDNLNLQLRTLAQLESLFDAGIINLIQVDRFRQSVEATRSSLLLQQNNYQLALDRYKTSTLGLPPNLPIELDDRLIHQFQLVDREATSIQDRISALQDQAGDLPEVPSVEQLRQFMVDIQELIEPLRTQISNTQADVAAMDEAVELRERTLTPEEAEDFSKDREQLHEGLFKLLAEFQLAEEKLPNLQKGLTEKNEEQTADALVLWLRNLYRLGQGSILIQARARLESVSVDTIVLDPEEALQVALENRLDFMNARAALVDSWRAIQFRADALQSTVNITSSGEIRTAKNNMVSFRAPTGSLRLGVEFDAPFTRLLERNDYRSSLIQYQQNRRNLIQSQDSLHLGLRALLRRIELLRTNLEIQRRAVRIAIRRVDLTREALYAPVAPPQPGQQAAQFGPTAAFDLLSAQNALRDTQNSFLGVWLNYYAARMRLNRELGIMMLDEEGRWIDYPLPGSGDSGSTEDVEPGTEELPPPADTEPATTEGPATEAVETEPIGTDDGGDEARAQESITF